MKILSRKIRRSSVKHIVISSFAIAKNLEFCKQQARPNYRRDKPSTTLYLHSPMQYIWSHHDEYLQQLS
ncbi:MAG: hypothetical protein GXP45_01100 [bacterium]|nr:hypothetical protein [bacterium]